MVSPALGTKRGCPKCSAPFYDLGKNPAVCPKCGHSFDPTQPVRARRKKKIEQAQAEAKKQAANIEIIKKKAEALKKQKDSEDEMGDLKGVDLDSLEEMDDEVESIDIEDGDDEEEIVIESDAGLIDRPDDDAEEE